jgi:nucleotide-binding universal stress UspA family protein
VGQDRVRGEAAQQAPVLLVAYGTGPMSDAQLHLACRSANDIGGIVHVLHVVERSRHVPLTVPLSAEEQQRADALLDRAEHIVAHYGVPCRMETHQSRSVGEAIIGAAREHDAHAIFIGLRDRHRAGTSILLSGTVRHVLQNAPCPVQIGYLPAELPDDFAHERDA